MHNTVADSYGQTELLYHGRAVDMMDLDFAKAFDIVCRRRLNNTNNYHL